MSRIPSTPRAVLDDLPLGPKSSSCEQTDPEDGAWFRCALADGRDPAVVHLALQRMAR